MPGDQDPEEPEEALLKEVPERPLIRPDEVIEEQDHDVGRDAGEEVITFKATGSKHRLLSNEKRIDI